MLSLLRTVAKFSALLAFGFAAVGAARAQSDPLSTLRSGHPRLIFLDSDIPAIKANIASDPFATATFAELKSECDKMLTQPVKPYVIKGSESNLLDTARDVEHIVLSLSGLYRITGERKYADRAIQEMLSAAAFPDWYPKHFLDTAELTAALGLGYDWLYPILSAQQRETIHKAIVTHGLDPWLEITQPVSATNPKGPKFHMTNNWVQVCVGGETVGALALADKEPARARTIISASQNQMRDIMKLFAPDGGFEEGPTYWGYATSYNVLYLAALDSAIGNDFGLSQMPGFAETGSYRLQALGPTYKPANFGDAHDDVFRAPQMFWMATKFHKPEYALGERRIDEAFPHIEHHNAGEAQRFLIFALVFYRPPTTASDPETVQSFARIDQAFLRSAWTSADGKPDLDAWFVAFKGGSAKASHGHLDLGSFVLDALGERWAIDLGPESYGVPGYFGKQRFTYFRTRNESHNTLTVDSANEDLDAYARLTVVGHTTPVPPNTATRKFAIMDLQSAYKDKLKNWQRGVEILNSNSALVQDEIVPHGDADIVWNLFTHAQIELGPNQDAVLLLNGKMLHLRILSPAGAQFEERPIPTLAPPETTLTGVSNLSIHLPKISEPATLTVLFSAGEHISIAPSPRPPIVPLAQWSKPAASH